MLPIKQALPDDQRELLALYAKLSEADRRSLMSFGRFLASQGSADFLFKVRAVTSGRFFRPPTLAEAMYRRDVRALVPGGFVRIRSSR